MNFDQSSGLYTALNLLTTVGYILQIIAGWKIFVKAGEKGWKSLVPIYNLFVQYKLTWKSFMAAPVIILMSLLGVTQYYPNATALYIIGGLGGIVGTVLTIIGQNKLSKAFGKGKGFTVGLILLSPIFYMILGFGKAQYIGNTTVADVTEKAAE